MTASAQATRRWPWPVAVLFWLAFSAFLLAGKAGPVSQLVLPDADDYVRLVQVEQWLDGGGFRDVGLPRLDPPAGVVMHWSRLPDLPIAAVILAVEPFSDRQTAVTAALLVVPALYMLGFLLLVTAISARLFGPGPALLAPLLAIFAVPAIGAFMPGRIDHHNIQVLLALVMLDAATRLYAGQGRRWAIVMGAAGGLAIAIGAEALPQILACYAALGLGWILGRPAMLRAGLLMSTTLAATASGILVLAVARNSYFAAACDSLSLVYVVATGLAAAVWAILWALDRFLTTAAARALVAAVLAAGALAILLAAYPACAGGPYGALPQELKESWLASVDEAQSALHLARKDMTRLNIHLLLPVIALVGLSLGAWRHRDNPVWLPLLVFTGVTLAIAILQIRATTAANAIAIIGAVHAYAALYDGVRRRARALPHLAASAVVIALLPLSIFAATGGLSERAAQTERRAVACGLPQSLAVLDTLPPGAVMAPANLGAIILAHTRHAVFAAHYHRDVDGLLAAQRVFEAASPDVALAEIRRKKADYVVVCLGKGPYGLKAPNADSFAGSLVAGAAPSWLSRVPDDKLEIFRVMP
ncbi:hypothetical protein [Iodidimonas sp. SYSU 1G8]|uniref:hypothetical protein n=1 Tax=Iodidimonas sp. SYSU 1G8 TaxID=3133967 RepID=UPI0031FE6859